MVTIWTQDSSTSSACHSYTEEAYFKRQFIPKATKSIYFSSWPDSLILPFWLFFSDNAISVCRRKCELSGRKHLCMWQEVNTTDVCSQLRASLFCEIASQDVRGGKKTLSDLYKKRTGRSIRSKSIYTTDHTQITLICSGSDQWNCDKCANYRKGAGSSLARL